MRSKKFRSTLITFGIVIAAFIACQVMISTGSMTRSLKGQLVPICAYVVMAISLNLTVGILGELSLGHAGFMSVGAFAGIVTTTESSAFAVSTVIPVSAASASEVAAFITASAETSSLTETTTALRILICRNLFALVTDLIL